MLPLLELAGDDQIHRVRDAVDLLAQQFKLTAEERREVIPSGRVSRFHNNVTWARTYLKKAGLLEDPKRGEFRITERGRQVLAGGHGSIGVRFLEQFEEFKKFKMARRIPRPDAAAKLDLPEETRRRLYRPPTRRCETVSPAICSIGRHLEADPAQRGRHVGRVVLRVRQPPDVGIGAVADDQGHAAVCQHHRRHREHDKRQDGHDERPHSSHLVESPHAHPTTVDTARSCCLPLRETVRKGGRR